MNRFRLYVRTDIAEEPTPATEVAILVSDGGAQYSVTYDDLKDLHSMSSVALGVLR